MFRRMLCTLFALLSLSAVSAFADSQVRIVRLSYVEGDVQIDRGDGNGFNRAFLNMPVIEGARLWARNDGQVEVEFEDGSTARLTPDTIMEFGQLRMQGEARLTLMNIQEGGAYFNFNKKHEDDLTVTAGQQYITPKKSSHFRLDVNKVELNLAVFKGDVELLKRNGERVQVRKNETLTLNFTDPDRYYLAKGIRENAQDEWDRQRDEDIAAYASRQHFDGYSSAYSYGFSDLNRYGNFINVSNYGSVWQPYGVGYGWSPFQDGSWVYYPGQGYVWVSPYRWGWTPYRYGSWVNVSGYGWCWRPGRNWSNWSAAPVVVTPPAGFVRPTPPPTPGVGIVHVGHGGDNIDLGRRRRERDAGSSSASVPRAPVSGAVSSSSGNTNNPGGPTTVDRVRGTHGAGSTVFTNDDIDRLSRERVARTPQVNTVVAPATPSQPAAVSPTPVTAPATIAPRNERPSRGDGNQQHERPANSPSYDRPARTSPPPQPAMQPAASRAPSYSPPPAPAASRTPSYSPPPAPAAAPASSSGGGARESRTGRDPK
jgi:hypothetical protein